MLLLAVSSAITSLTSDSPDGSTLVLNWQPPDSPNGDILYYTVRISRHSDRVRISEKNILVTKYTATNLSESDLYLVLIISTLQLNISVEGVPYNVSITPVNLAGPGSINSVTLFTRELSKHYVLN